MDSDSESIIELDRDTREALELDELLAWVATHARTPMGAERIARLAPRTDADCVRGELDSVEEMRRLGLQQGWLLPSALPDPAGALAGLEVEGLRLDPKVLREVATVATAAASIGQRLRSGEGTDYPRLRERVRDLADLRPEAAAVLEGTDAAGRLLDDASPLLASIRLRTTRLESRVRRMLERLVRDPGAADTIRDDFVTQRNGRYVVPVRTDAPRRVRGIVHASSSSGATQFVEPLESVELNNDLMRLAEEEREEQQRILLGWTDAFRRRRDELSAAVETLGCLDDLQARARFAEEVRARAPRVGADQPLYLRGARHPLLDRRLREQGAETVPLDLELDPADRVLIISGPNTGGKTVALKTVGLIAVMGQSGIPVPAADARLPLYRQVRADIGDHQSIQADLSTFSAHMRALVELLRQPRPPALYLIDEIGTGTEPGEGAALAREVLGALAQPGLTTVVTTHLGQLKSWAVTSERTACAAMEFDTAALRPTYRLQMGLPGVSAGLDIAERLGLPRKIVEGARARMSATTRESEGYLERLRELSLELERRADDLRRREAELEAEAAARREQAERDRATTGRSAGQALDRALRDFKRSAARELERLRALGVRSGLDRAGERAERRVGGEHHALRAQLSGQRPAGAPEDWVAAEASLEPGSRVFVCNLGREGRLVEHRGDFAEVQLGGVVFTVPLSELRLPPEAEGRRPVVGEPVVRVPEREVSAPRELHVVGQRVAEALEAVDRFLDAAVLSGHDEVRIVHGHGTGRLRRAIRRHLDDTPQVARHAPGGRHDGGDGATVVTLR